MKNDQVTLRDLALYLKSFLRFISETISYILKILKKYALYFILAILVGGIAGYWKYKNQPVYYEGGITCVYSELHKKIYGEMILTLDKYIKDDADAMVAKLLNIDPETARNLKEIKALNIAGKPLHEDVTMEKLPFYIKYQTTDPANAQKINSGLLNYLRSGEFNRSRKEVRLSNAENKIQFIDKQLTILDSIKRNFYNYHQLSKNADQTNSMMKFDVAELFKESERLFNLKQDAEWVLRFDDSVEMIDESLPTSKVMHASLTNYLIKYCVLFFVICFFISVYFFSVKKLLSDKGQS
jgi:hypothetical protein